MTNAGWSNMFLKIHVYEIRGPSVGVRVNPYVVPVHWLSHTT